MLRRLVLAAVASAAALAAPASADPLPDVSTDPIGGVHYEVHAEDGRVSFGTSVPGQPLLGGYVDANTASACVGFSLQVPVCSDRVVDRVRELIGTD